MSEERNAEVVRRLAELWNAGDFDGVLAYYDDDVEVITDPGWPDPPTRGKEAFARSSVEWRSAWEKIDIEVGGIQAKGDIVVADGAWDTRGASSGIGGSIPFGLVYTLRDGLVTRMRWYMDPAEARRDAGL